MTTTSYAFVLDASACSGCKACQAACKDKNALAPGVVWRRVYEISGGSWKQEGAAWTNSVFAYNLSLACNHCVHPKCAGVCPVNAYFVREDGLVILDPAKCVGCGYCAWACPYEAPQYDRAAGRMTKCNFCYDNLEMGLPPACVAACPMRVLDYTAVEEGQRVGTSRLELWGAPASEHPYPLPHNSRTQPHLAIKPHAGMRSTETKAIGNIEEVHPQKRTGWEETPLIAFTLLMQAAAGGIWAMLLFVDAHLRLLPMLLIGLCTGVGLLTSFAHLGTKLNAWRVLSNLKKSCLSREILYSLLFAAGWLAGLASLLLRVNPPLMLWLTALLGVELIHSMAGVYRLRAVPAWDTPHTEIQFLLSAALLGILLMLPFLAGQAARSPGHTAAGLVVMALLAAQAVLRKGEPPSIGGKKLQYSLLCASAFAASALFLVPAALTVYSSLALMLSVLTEQALGRWAFYRARTGWV